MSKIRGEIPLRLFITVNILLLCKNTLFDIRDIGQIRVIFPNVRFEWSNTRKSVSRIFLFVSRFQIVSTLTDSFATVIAQVVEENFYKTRSIDSKKLS